MNYIKKIKHNEGKMHRLAEIPMEQSHWLDGSWNGYQDNAQAQLERDYSEGRRLEYYDGKNYIQS